jgi:hypothetical protein
VNAETRKIEDNFRIIKKQSAIFVDVSQIMTGFAGMTVDDVNRERESCLQIQKTFTRSFQTFEQICRESGISVNSSKKGLSGP